MVSFFDVLKSQFPFWSIIFVISLLSGIGYSINLLGYALPDGTLLEPDRLRSLHISLMLYGPVMLILSLLPIALFHKDGIDIDAQAHNLRNYFLLWNLFLLAMIVTFLLGLTRNLPFYDHRYELNFILAFAGIFYIIAVLKSAGRYISVPLWVKVSKIILFAAPVLLLVLMNPQIGQVEETIYGPHGDNTLGMSFALIPLYYLIIKLNAADDFKPAWPWLWIVPLAGYATSVGMRALSGPLSYGEEWLFQWLTFLYAPLLMKWLYDAKLTYRSSPYLVVSVAAFLFVMVEGNILFIPEIRWLFHRNDLIVGHAHVAVAIGLFFMALSVLDYFMSLPRWFASFWSVSVGVMMIVLSIAGFSEAGFDTAAVDDMWAIRSVIGVVMTAGVIVLLIRGVEIPKFTPVRLYNLGGFLSDGAGGVLLIVTAPLLFSLLGIGFHPLYYIVFGFMVFVGMLHLKGVVADASIMAGYTAYARVITGILFYALYSAGLVDLLGLLVAIYDIGYALIYLLGMRR
jgi:hypothetical protein